MIKGGVGGGNTYKRNSHYYFDYIPLQKLGLPVPEQ